MSIDDPFLLRDYLLLAIMRFAPALSDPGEFRCSSGAVIGVEKKEEEDLLAGGRF